jgi:hypothetical protein
MADDDNDPNDQMLEDSESLDSDELGEGVGDGVADAPDDWAGADRIGTTAREERDGETLDERLAEELPDIGATERPDRPLANTYTEDLDEVTNNVVVLGERADGEDIAYD